MQQFGLMRNKKEVLLIYNFKISHKNENKNKKGIFRLKYENFLGFVASSSLVIMLFSFNAKIVLPKMYISLNKFQELISTHL